LDKLKAKNPQDSTDFDSGHRLTAEEMDEMRRDYDWQKTEAESFSVKKIRQYFARCAPVSAQDVDGWRPRGHCLTLKTIFTKGIGQRLLEANSLRSKSPTTASDLLSLAQLGGGHRPPSPRSTSMSQIS